MLPGIAANGTDVLCLARFSSRRRPVHDETVAYENGSAFSALRYKKVY
jgi:hypothetical protein